MGSPLILTATRGLYEQLIREVRGMVADQAPAPDFGFVYILSNPSMPGLYKIGLTTVRVRQRIDELNTTGVPTPFAAERIFQISARHLATVEKSAHKRLRERGFHHGKEFFRASLDTCVRVVEDAIWEFTGEQSIDIVGQARERAAVEQHRRQQEQEERDRARSVQARLDAQNNDIRGKRNRFVEEQLKLWSDIKSSDPFSSDQIFLYGAVVVGPVAFLLGGPFLLICAIGLGWWVYAHNKSQQRQEQSKLRRDYEAAAERMFPLATTTPYQQRAAPSSTHASPPTYGFSGSPMYTVEERRRHLETDAKRLLPLATTPPPQYSVAPSPAADSTHYGMARESPLYPSFEPDD